MLMLLLSVTVMGGALLSAQSSINGAFSKKAGTLESAFLTFGTGTLMLVLLVLFFGTGKIGLILEAPTWQLSAVWLGVGYLFLTILAVPKIGVIAANLAAIIGQLSTGMLIDHFGLFNGVVIPFDWNRMVAFVLMLIALRLLYIANMKQQKRQTMKRHAS